MIVDPDPALRQSLRELLEGAGHVVREAAGSAAALQALAGEKPDLIVLESDLPDGRGFDVLEQVRSDPATGLLPVVLTTRRGGEEARREADRLAASELFLKPVPLRKLLSRIDGLLWLQRLAAEHEHVDHMIATLARTIDVRDPFTAGHSQRTAELSDRVAARLGLTAAERRVIGRGALFHDFGEIVLPDAVLKKPGRLTDEERAVMEQHPITAMHLLSPMKSLEPILPIVTQHHEKLDGSGYPLGLTAPDLAMTVRIVSVVDIYDAVTHARTYREALPASAAFEILGEGVKKGWWDGEAVALLEAEVSERPADP
ncbi:MAG TPA: HD domain-containing phosphohydrolase [Thermoanaerobaculia bacterium]